MPRLGVGAAQDATLLGCRLVAPHLEVGLEEHGRGRRRERCRRGPRGRGLRSDGSGAPGPARGARSAAGPRCGSTPRSLRGRPGHRTTPVRRRRAPRSATRRHRAGTGARGARLHRAERARSAGPSAPRRRPTSPAAQAAAARTSADPAAPAARARAARLAFPPDLGQCHRRLESGTGVGVGESLDEGELGLRGPRLLDRPQQPRPEGSVVPGRSSPAGAPPRRRRRDRPGRPAPGAPPSHRPSGPWGGGASAPRARWSPGRGPAGSRPASPSRRPGGSRTREERAAGARRELRRGRLPRVPGAQTRPGPSSARTRRANHPGHRCPQGAIVSPRVRHHTVIVCRSERMIPSARPIPRSRDPPTGRER